jgi:nucleotide-binding universal stress UspA family protein
VAAAARDRHVDLIVIGRGGAPELSGRLGSHAYAIVRRAPCPVLCV